MCPVLAKYLKETALKNNHKKAKMSYGARYGKEDPRCRPDCQLEPLHPECPPDCNKYTGCNCDREKNKQINNFPVILWF